MSHEDGDMCFKPGLKEISPSLVDDLAKRPDIKEITTAEALALIGANDWTEGVVKAKELAGIVDEVEHPITEGSVWRISRTEYTIVKEPKGWIARDLNSGYGSSGHHENIEDVLGSCRNEAVWLRDAEPAPKSEDVRWYFLEEDGSIRGYARDKKASFHHDGYIVHWQHVASESGCISRKHTVLSTAEVLCRLARAGHIAAWNGARKLAGMSEQEAYLAGQSVCGIEVGDTVRVTRFAADHEMGWALKWASDSESSEPWVVDVFGSYGAIHDGGNYFPYFVLEKIETPAEATPVETPTVVAPEIDPGGGWEITRISPDNPIQEGDQFQRPTGEWLGIMSWQVGNTDGQGLVFRRRIQSATSPSHEIDPGEGWRLVEVGEELLDSDQFYETSSKTWVPRYTSGSIMQEDYTPQRRRIQPAADHVNKWAGGYWSLGKFVSGRPCGVEVTL